MRNVELALIALFAALASTIQTAQTTNPLLSAILQARKRGRPLTAEERLQQEQALYQHLKSLTQEQVAVIQKKMPPALMQRMVERLKVLKRQEKTRGALGAAAGRPNTVTSGASSVRRSGSDHNSLGGAKGDSSGSSRRAMMARMAAVARRMMAVRSRRLRPMASFIGYRSFTSKAQGAMRAGCSYPISTESVVETFVAGSGGCRMSAAVCYMKGQSCVDMGMSMMCCPPGFSSGTLRMFNQMKRMQTLINNLS